MTDAEKIAMVTALTGETDNAVISAFLAVAGEKICRIASPFEVLADVPEKYDHLHVEAACYLINKRGAEGESSHGENGISRSYENADLPASMLRSITPMAGVVN